MTVDEFLKIVPSLVEKGIDLLNIQRPGWHNQINLDTLDMSWGRMCIIGQLHPEVLDGPYGEGIDALGLGALTAFDHGFSLFRVDDPTIYAWNALRAEWVK